MRPEFTTHIPPEKEGIGRLEKSNCMYSMLNIKIQFCRKGTFRAASTNRSTCQLTDDQPKTKTKINCAFNLDTAGWIMGRHKGQRLTKIELYEHKGETGFYCEFETAPEDKCDYREFTRMREEQPEELRLTVAAGLAALTTHLNQLLKGNKIDSALNKNGEVRHE